MIDMDCDIAAYVASVGESSAIESSLEKLIVEGFSVKIFTEGKANEMLSQNQALKNHLKDSSILFATDTLNPKLFITGSSQEKSVELLKRFKEKHVQTIVFLDNDSLEGEDPFFKTAQKVASAAGCVFVPNQHLAKEEILKEKEVHTVGQPGVDAFIQEVAQVNKKEILARLGLDAGKKTVVFFGGRGEEYQNNFLLFLDSISQLSWLDYQIIIKPHPAQLVGFEEQAFFEWKKSQAPHKHPMIFFLGQDSDIRTAQLTKTADVVACPVSSVATKVASVKKPLIFFASHKECQGFKLFELGYGHLFQKGENFEHVFNAEAKKDLDLYEIMQMPTGSSLRIVSIIKNFFAERQREERI